jgi:hypothetical protein
MYWKEVFVFFIIYLEEKQQDLQQKILICRHRTHNRADQESFPPTVSFLGLYVQYILFFTAGCLIFLITSSTGTYSIYTV